MNTFEIHIQNRDGQVETYQVQADNPAEAQLGLFPEDRLLCRNPFVVLENCPQFERQIVAVKEITQTASAPSA